MGRLSRENVKPEPVDDDETIEVKREEPSVEADLAEGLSAARVTAVKEEEDAASVPSSPSLAATRLKPSRASSSAASTPKPPPASNSAAISAKKEAEETNGHPSPVKSEVAKPAKMTRTTTTTTTSKLPPRVASLLDQLPDVTAEATSTFTVIDACTYQNKYLGFTDHALDCDCTEEWGESSSTLPPLLPMAGC